MTSYGVRFTHFSMRWAAGSNPTPPPPGISFSFFFVFKKETIKMRWEKKQKCVDGDIIEV